MEPKLFIIVFSATIIAVGVYRILTSYEYHPKKKDRMKPYRDFFNAKQTK